MNEDEFLMVSFLLQKYSTHGAGSICAFAHDMWRDTPVSVQASGVQPNNSGGLSGARPAGQAGPGAAQASTSGRPAGSEQEQSSLLARVVAPFKDLALRGTVYTSFVFAKQPKRIRQVRSTRSNGKYCVIGEISDAWHASWIFLCLAVLTLRSLERVLRGMSVRRQIAVAVSPLENDGEGGPLFGRCWSRCT
jgi:hypothetical protein